MRGLRGRLTLIAVTLVVHASAVREPLPPMGTTPMTKSGPQAWDNYAVDPNKGLLDGGFTRLLTHSVADATAVQ